MTALAEMIVFLKTVAADFRSRRRFGDVLQAEVAQDIAADIATEQGRAARLAYAAQQADLEAEHIMRTVLADNRVTADEIPLLRTAQRHVHRSATTDQKITDALDL